MIPIRQNFIVFIIMSMKSEVYWDIMYIKANVEHILSYLFSRKSF